MATAKSVALARELIDVWSKQVSASFAVIAETFEAVSGNPIITLSDGSPAAGEKTIVVRVRPVTWTATDILGNAAQMFCPHIVDICTETNAAGTPNILTPFEILPILCELGKRGLMVLWYQSPNLTPPAVAQMTAAQLSATYSDLYWSASKAQ
jgi:hypothetical protein